MGNSTCPAYDLHHKVKQDAKSVKEIIKKAAASELRPEGHNPETGIMSQTGLKVSPGGLCAKENRGDA